MPGKQLKVWATNKPSHSSEAYKFVEFLLTWKVIARFRLSWVIFQGRARKKQWLIISPRWSSCRKCPPNELNSNPFLFGLSRLWNLVELCSIYNMQQVCEFDSVFHSQLFPQVFISVRTRQRNCPAPTGGSIFWVFMLWQIQSNTGLCYKSGEVREPNDQFAQPLNNFALLKLKEKPDFNYCDLEQFGQRKWPLARHFVHGVVFTPGSSPPSNWYKSSTKLNLISPPSLTEPTPRHVEQAIIFRSPHFLHIPSELHTKRHRQVFIRMLRWSVLA